MPFRADTASGYIQAVALQYAATRATWQTGHVPDALPFDIEMRFRYNQAFRSIYAISPGVLMLMLAMIPAILTAVGVVREKETGAIVNFRASPVSAFEFLLGKQLPYAAIAAVSYLLLLSQILVVFGVPLKGSGLTLTLGALLFVLGTTGFGILISAFARTQVAALFVTAIATIIPAINFSGLLVPVSSLPAGSRFFGLAFPGAWFQQISIGTITKGLGILDLWPYIATLTIFTLVYIGIAALALKKQEA